MVLFIFALTLSSNLFAFDLKNEFYETYNLECKSADTKYDFKMSARFDVKWNAYHTGNIGASGKAVIDWTQDGQKGQLKYWANIFRTTIDWYNRTEFYAAAISGSAEDVENAPRFNIEYNHLRTKAEQKQNIGWGTKENYQTKPLKCDVTSVGKEVTRDKFTYSPPSRP